MDELQARLDVLRDAASRRVVALDDLRRRSLVAQRVDVCVVVVEARRTPPTVLHAGRKLVAMTTPVVGPTLTVAHEVDAQRGSAGLFDLVDQPPSPAGSPRMPPLSGGRSSWQKYLTLRMLPSSRVLVVEDGRRAQRLWNAHGNREQPADAFDLLDLNACFALDVGIERDEAGEREGVVLGDLDVEDVRLAHRSCREVQSAAPGFESLSYQSEPFRIT